MEEADMEKILTITVPSYNVERFLHETLDSFVDERMMEELEVLVIDDGSKDGTARIGKEYEEKYPQTFRVISKENGGHGSAINRGIREAKGKYFKVVDGDDWADTEGLIRLVGKLSRCHADYVITDYYEVNDITKERTEVRFSSLVPEKETSFEEAAKKVQIPMHALVIRTEILRKHEIFLDEHCFYVDVEYVLYPVPYVETVCYYDIFVYMYRLAQAEQSVSMQGFRNHMQNHIDVIFHTLDYINAYKAGRNAQEIKARYMAKRIAQMINDQVSIFVSFPLSDKKIRRQFREFDRTVKVKNPLVYKWAGECSGLLRTLRKTNFRFYPFFASISRLRSRM